MCVLEYGRVPSLVVGVEVVGVFFSSSFFFSETRRKLLCCSMEFCWNERCMQWGLNVILCGFSATIEPGSVYVL